MRRTTTVMISFVVFVLMLGLGASPSQASPVYVLLTTIDVPASADNSVGGKFATYDIAYFDGTTQLMYLADRSNASVDIFSAKTNTFVGRIGGSGHLFVGQQASNDTSGPDGVVVANFGSSKQLWAGDGPSLLKGFDLNIPGFPQLANTPINTGATPPTRVDEMAFDPRDKLLLVANNAADPPFATLVDTTTNSIVPKGKITFDGTNADGHNAPKATNGIEQSVWDPSHGGRFFISIPELNGSGPGGVAMIDPLTGNVTKVYDLTVLSGGTISSCSPAGLALGVGGKLMVGCGNGGTQSILLDPNANNGNGSIKTFAQVSGEDMVWFDPTTDRYFLAARLNQGGPVLGIIDALTETFLQNVRTTPNDHSVAVDPVSGEVFVPFGGVAGNTVCPNGCVAVFITPEPGSLLLLGAGLIGLGGLSWRRRRRA
jgi:PEP-CTERM motif-containing protein